MNIESIDTPNGITVLCPYSKKLQEQNILLTIYYYKRKPTSLTDVQCVQPEEIIGQQEGRMTSEGLLFYVEEQLKKGFYRVYLKTKSGQYKGDHVYPILHGENSLLIGLPYSSYEAVDLN